MMMKICLDKLAILLIQLNIQFLLCAITDHTGVHCHSCHWITVINPLRCSGVR